MPQYVNPFNRVPSVHAYEHINGVLQYGFIYKPPDNVTIAVGVEGHYPKTHLLP
jgi:hypothetical protein